MFYPGRALLFVIKYVWISKLLHCVTQKRWRKESCCVGQKGSYRFSFAIISQNLDSIYWKVTIFSFGHMTGENQE